MWRWKKNSVWLAWLRSYTLILLIPIVLMVIAYLQTGGIVEEEINRSKDALLQQLQQDLDNQIEHVQRLGDVIALNPRVRSLAFAGSQLNTENRLTIVQAVTDFRAYNTTNILVDQFYIWFKKGQFVLSNAAYYEPDTFFRLNLQEENVTYETWKSNMERMYRGQFFNARDVIGSQEAAAPFGSIVYMRSLPIEEPNHSSATLAIHLDEERLREAMQSVLDVHRGKLFILDGDRKLLLTSAERDAVALDGIVDRLEGDSGALNERIGGEEAVVSYIRSQVTNWRYVYVLPARIYEEKLVDVRNLTIASIVVSLLIGIATAVLLARRNYFPLMTLVKTLSIKAKRPVAPGGNEYSFIEEAVEETFNENNQMHRLMEQQSRMLRSNFLARLLKGRLENHYPLEDALSTHRIRFETDTFAVMLFYIEDFTGLFREEEHDTEKKLKFVQLILQNIVEETISQRHRAYMTEVDDMMACIVNVSDNAGTAVLDDLLELVEEARQFIGRRFYIQFKVSVSALHHTSMAGLPAAYQEAAEAMEYRMFGGAETVFRYEQIRKEDEFYPYSIEQEQQLINFVKAGELEAASAIVKEVIERRLVGSGMSVEMARCLMFDMISTMMKASAEVLSGQPELYRDNRQAMQALLQCETAVEMQERILLFLQKVCGYVQQRKRSNNVQLKAEVLQYIAERRTDPNLSITTVADHFGLHASYLSRFFKEQIGEAISEYITKARIAEAKRLLLEGDADLTIKTVAEQVGFCSISTFIRTFKKYEGVTPSIFRESQSQ